MFFLNLIVPLYRSLMFLFQMEEAISLSERFLQWFLFRFRWVFVIFFVLPASLLYDGYFTVRNYVIFRLNSAPKAHDRKVAVIQRQVRDLYVVIDTF